ncbi:MAG: hypothetical protein ACYDC6_12110 [Acidobacteriaceae bacterium]
MRAAPFDVDEMKQSLAPTRKFRAAQMPSCRGRLQGRLLPACIYIAAEACFWPLVLMLALAPSTIHAQIFSRHASPSVVDDVRPDATIPVASLGYRPPGELPAYQYYSLVGLHFVDATHLLFTFNTTGLLRRDYSCSGGDSERLVRAVVLELPSGKVDRQTEWKLYDFSDFLWALGNGQFLLRRCSQLDRVDASLAPTPFISLGGSLRAMSFSPDHSVLVVQEKPAPRNPTNRQYGNGSTSALSQQADAMLGSQMEPELNVDFIRLRPLAVLVRSQVPRAVDVPLVTGGFLEMMAAIHSRWIVFLQPYQGDKRQIVAIESDCPPALTAISGNVFVAQTCPKSDQMAYEGYNLQGSLLWHMPFSSDRVLPRFILTQNGAHFAIETLHASHPRAALDPLSSEGIDGEIVDIYDTMTGVPIASLRTTPVYTSGQNVDFSPDGTRIAVLHDSAIEIYDLDALAKSQQSVPR